MAAIMGITLGNRKIDEKKNRNSCYNYGILVTMLMRKENTAMPGNIKTVIATIDYIESHLHEKLDLDTIAEALHYSKYHLHRMFTGTVWCTII